MSPDQIQRFVRPYDWETIDPVIHDQGAVILKGFFSEEATDLLNRELDDYLKANPSIGSPSTGSPSFDKFLGRRTVRLQCLTEKVTSVTRWFGNPEMCAWAERALAPISTSALLNSAEMIQVGPGERKQPPHRDTDSWPAVPLGEHTVQVGALIALSPCTVENGATRVALGSWRWGTERQPQPEELSVATMAPGDAFLLRGDVWHAAGANETETQRRILGVTYVAGWLRPYENNLLTLSKEQARELEPHVRHLLGFAAYDGSALGGAVLGSYNYGDPAHLFEE